MSKRTKFGEDAFTLGMLEARVMLAADPITPDNPLWVALPGTVTIDGKLDEAVWANAVEVRRSEAFRSNSTSVIKFLYDTNGLYIGLDVADTALWTDGRGAGIAQRWEVEQDDSMTFYFDSDESRDEYFGGNDRAFGVNLGNPTDPTLGAGRIKLVKYVKGDGAGGAPDVNPGGTLATGLTWSTVLNGTLNNNADTDVGWTTEIFLPWASLNMAAPSNGKTIGVNFDIIFDNDGTTRNLTDNRDTADRWTKPAFVDDHLQGVESSYAATLAGIRGPVNYAKLMFLDPAALSKPAAITGMTATNTTGYSTTLSFNAPAGTTDGLGGVSSYQIRFSTSPITGENEWLTASVFNNAYVPRLAGLAESLRLINLTPGTTYWVAVRGVDAAGHLGSLSNIVTFTTQTTVQDVSGGRRLVPSPMGGMLVTEKNEAFVSIGDHLGLSWNYTRNLYTGSVWNSSNGTYVNFNTNPSYEGTAGPYFDTLQAKGVNTMRVYLELQNVYKPPTYGTDPQGTLWLEWREGGVSQFNDDMRKFMLNVLKEASSRGIYVIFSPFDTFSYDETFATEFPWSVLKGGPLGTIDNFFQTPAVLDLCKARMDVVTGWVKSAEFAPYVKSLIGWELLSEWDSYEWTLNAEGNAKNTTNPADQNLGREVEFRTRSIFMQNLAQYVRSIDPQRLVLNSTIAQDPRGPEARLVFYSRAFDLLTPHFYTNGNEEPVNNPDSDRSVRPAVDNANLTSYWTSMTTNRRPIINGEWGMTRADWQNAGKGLPHYSSDFTQVEDEAIFRTMLWSGLASGQAGGGLRIATEELNFSTGGGQTQGYILTNAMRNEQLVMRKFVDSTSLIVNFNTFAGRSLSGDLSSSFAQGKTVKSLELMGVTDGTQGMVYVLQNGNKTTGTVSGASIAIENLRRDQVIDVEIWLTTAGTTAPTQTISGLNAGSGKLVVALPDFTTDVVIKFKARQGTNLSQRVVSIASGSELITFTLDNGRQPVASIYNTQTGITTTQKAGALARFVGRVVDMTPFVTSGQVNLAVTDENHHVWLIEGVTSTASWFATDLTALINAPGLTGDLTTYQPSWGAIHIAGLDARGHAINYWYVPGTTTTWQFSDLTQLFNGPTMTGGLTGYVAGWDGLNLAGLNSANEVIVYWWAPGLTDWQTLNMTTYAAGPTFTGQLDAYVTPWGGLNIAGRTTAGHVVTYWWAPGLDKWYVSDLTDASSGPILSDGVEVAVSSDGGINIFATDSSKNLHMLRWVPGAGGVWQSTNVTSLAVGPVVRFPAGSSAAGTKLQVAARAETGNKTVRLFTYDTTAGIWANADTGLYAEI